MDAGLLNNNIEGLAEQIGQPLKPVKDPPSEPSPPYPGPGHEHQEAPTGEWSFKFVFSEPHSLKMIVTVPTPTSDSEETQFSSEMDKNHVNKLNEWLHRVLALMEDWDEPI